MLCTEKAFTLLKGIYLVPILSALVNKDGNGGIIVQLFYKIGKLSCPPLKDRCIVNVWWITCLCWINVLLISIMIWLLGAVVFHMIARPCPCGIGEPMENPQWIPGPAPVG